MIMFFDRSVGITIPLVLRKLRLPVRVEFHQGHFPSDAPDDAWLPVVGQWGWTVIGHDTKYHLTSNELAALKQYSVGCFYLWGANASKWEKMRVFAFAYRRIVAAEGSTPKPFIYRVDRRGLLKPVDLP